MLKLLLTISLVSVAFGFDCKTSPSSKEPQDCCDTPLMVDMKIFTDCLGKYGEQTARQRELDGPKRGCCIGDCILVTTEVTTGKGDVDREKLTKMLTDKIGGNETWMGALTPAIDKCFKDADAKAEEFKVAAALEPAFEGEKICHPISGFVLNCIHTEVFENCPAAVWQGGEECDKIRNFVKECHTIPQTGA